MTHTTHSYKGQALITVIFVAVIGMLIAAGAIMTLVNAFATTSQQELGLLAYSTAESGIETGVLRLLRNPTYAGETLTVSAGRTATITVSTASGVVITSIGTVGTVSRKIVASGHYNSLTLVVDSWSEAP